MGRNLFEIGVIRSRWGKAMLTAVRQQGNLTRAVLVPEFYSVHALEP
ncbi:MAG: hypothetical protein ABSC19_05685 [Syntrophorhabdales bacterium]|jgi:hypothetical protein